MAAITTLRLGTRGSRLAQMQSQLVADALMSRFPSLRVDLVIIKTTGDKIQNKPLHEAGGKGLFTKELEQALLQKQVDFAVHSFKDVPVTMPLVDVSELVFAAIPEREDPRDVLVSVKAKRIRDLPKKAKVGTGSLRRAAQLLEKRPDLQILPIRGNVDTRIKKLKEGQYDATILAMAGLKRSGLFDSSIMHPLDPDDFLPAPAQGALAIQCRRDARDVKGYLSDLDDKYTRHCVLLEREVVQRLDGDCHSPIAALAIKGRISHMTLDVAVASRDGRPPVIRASADGIVTAPTSMVNKVYKILRKDGVHDLLAGRR